MTMTTMMMNSNDEAPNHDAEAKKARKLEYRIPLIIRSKSTHFPSVFAVNRIPALPHPMKERGQQKCNIEMPPAEMSTVIMQH